MLKQYLRAWSKAYRAAADAIDKYIAQLEEMGLDLEEVKNPNTVADIALSIADKTFEETFVCEIGGDNSTFH